MLVVDSEGKNIYVLLISDRNLRLGGRLVYSICYFLEIE